MKSITVIIPVYNNENYLRCCLDSILSQTYTNLEIILVNDGSVDRSQEICEEYAKKDTRINVILQKNGGVSVARNTGLEAAHGDYISFVDADDYLEPDAYETLIHAFQMEAPDIVCFEYFITYKDHETAHSLPNKTSYGIKDRKQAMREHMTGVPHLWCKLFTKEVVFELRFIPGLARGEDGMFCRSALHNSRKVYYLDKPLYHYVQSEESAVRGVFRLNQLSFLHTYDDKEQFYSAHYPELLHIFYTNFSHAVIMLYCDMYADEKDYRKEQKLAYHAFLRAYSNIFASNIGIRTWTKFLYFYLFPKSFAASHVKRVKGHP